MSNSYTQKGVLVNTENGRVPVAPRELTRIEDVLGALESQQETIYRQITEIDFRLTGDEPVEEKDTEARGYEQRLQRLMWKNDIIIDKLIRLIERF